MNYWKTFGVLTAYSSIYCNVPRSDVQVRNSSFRGVVCFLVDRMVVVGENALVVLSRARAFGFSVSSF